MTVLEIDNLSYSYDGERDIISSISMRFDEPGLYCIVGPNGVGKSTLVKCINRIIPPTSGKVLVDGQDLSELKQIDIARLIGYVPTVADDAFSMPVIDAIQVACYSKGHVKSTRSLEEVYRVMKMLHIRNLANHGSKELSAGQKQKVTLARGLIQDAPILILDEPTANLDIKYQIYVTELLRAIAVSEGMIVIMISHDINIAAKYAHEIIMMGAPGVIRYRGAPREVVTVSNMKEIYSIDCEIIDLYGYPHVLPGTSVMDEDDLIEIPTKKSFFRLR